MEVLPAGLVALLDIILWVIRGLPKKSRKNKKGLIS